MSSANPEVTTAPAAPVQPDTILEADDSLEDEAYGTDSGTTYTSSISSSIMAYRKENGRTYHAYKDGSYFMPNDETENDRLDFQHAIFMRSLGGKLFLAPIADDVQEVLDAGTGTGIWAIDFADEYPRARVTGTDLSPTQPGFVPPNLSFYVEDMEAVWANNHKYDFIHGRMLNGSFQSMPLFFKQAFDNLKPGGYFEMQDLALPLRCDDDTMPPTSSLAQWSHHFCEAMGNMKRPVKGLAEKYKRMMEDAGFVDVVEVLHKWPTNSWPKNPKMKELGMWKMENFLQGLQGGTIAPFTRALGWTAAEVEVFLVGVRKDIQSRNVHAYFPMYFVYGRKPEAK